VVLPRKIFEKERRKTPPPNPLPEYRERGNEAGCGNWLDAVVMMNQE
jgi:hypothetical protein